MNLTCDGFHFYAPEKIKWYRHFLGRETQIETLGNTFQVHSSGDYRCQAEGSQLSNPVRLHFSSGEKEGELVKTLGMVLVHLSSLESPRTEAFIPL